MQKCDMNNLLIKKALAGIEQSLLIYPSLHSQYFYDAVLVKHLPLLDELQSFKQVLCDLTVYVPEIVIGGPPPLLLVIVSG
jgi:hypothetical protein